MGAIIDLTGQVFGRLTVIERAKNFYPVPGDSSGKVAWRCRCECGCERITTGESLRRGTTKSCGCLAKEAAIINARKAGQEKLRRMKVAKDAGLYMGYKSDY